MPEIVLYVVKSHFSRNFDFKNLFADHDGLTPLDHTSIDRSTLPKPYGHHMTPNATYNNVNFDVYVWGSNTTYNLGLGHEQHRPIPDINDFFRKENIRVKEVRFSKFHSAFVASDGQVYTW